VMSPTESAPTGLGQTPTTADDPKAVCVRSLQIMADGDLRDFETMIHPEATNREAAREPAARDRPRSTPRLYGSAGHFPICGGTLTK
jgi:hypothetical protein